MKINCIPYDEIKTEGLKNPAVLEAYLEEKKAAQIREQLEQLRFKAGLTQSQLAQKMGLHQPAIVRIEKNIFKTNLKTLELYANACNAKLNISFN